jgi:menaquinone-dependent protoporphyrinogen oxidase
MRVLVAYGSKRGGTQGLAQQVADGLRTAGFAVDVCPVDDSRDLSGYDAVIVGGALYSGRWHKSARAFVIRHAAELRHCPTYFFSSGPLDSAAVQRDIPPVGGVAELMRRVEARGHATFGGRLSPYARGFAASAMAKKQAGDWRDPGQVREWTRQVAAHLRYDLPVSA